MEMMDDEKKCCVELSETLLMLIGFQHGGKLGYHFSQVELYLFFWKLCHDDILTTEERVNSTLGTIPNWCRFGCDHHPVANQIHCFFNCTMTYNIGQWLLKIVRSFGPASELDVLRMNVPNNHALMWIIAETLHYCWTKRVSNKVADHPHLQAHLDSELKLMNETSLSQLADDIESILRQATF